MSIGSSKDKSLPVICCWTCGRLLLEQQNYHELMGLVCIWGWVRYTYVAGVWETGLSASQLIKGHPEVY